MTTPTPSVSLLYSNCYVLFQQKDQSPPTLYLASLMNNCFVFRPANRLLVEIISFLGFSHIFFHKQKKDEKSKSKIKTRLIGARSWLNDKF